MARRKKKERMESPRGASYMGRPEQLDKGLIVGKGLPPQNRSGMRSQIIVEQADLEVKY